MKSNAERNRGYRRHLRGVPFHFEPGGTYVCASEGLTLHGKVLHVGDTIPDGLPEHKMRALFDAGRIDPANS